ncbi:MAG: hypothetical protein QXG36_07545 [Nitrososphaeria archaeon]
MIEDSNQEIRILYEKWKELSKNLDAELAGMVNKYIEYTFLNNFTLDSSIDPATYSNLLKSMLKDLLLLFYVEYYKMKNNAGALSDYYKQVHIYNLYINAIMSFMVSIYDLFKRDKRYQLKLAQIAPGAGFGFGSPRQ